MEKVSDIIIKPVSMTTKNMATKMRPSTAQATLETCTTCGGIGWVRGDYQPGHKRFGRMFRCDECGGRARTAWLKKLSHLQGELASATLEDWIAEHKGGATFDDIRQYIWRRGDDMRAAGWITISGPYGTGKSLLLAAWCNYFISAGRPAVYISMQQILQDLRESYDPQSDTVFSQLWKDITTTAEVLFIDELQKWSGTAWAQEQVFALLSRRYENRHNLLTIMATNADLRKQDVQILPPGLWDNGYLLSRIRDGRNLVLTDLWYAPDMRPDLIEIFEHAPLDIPTKKGGGGGGP